MIKRTHILLAAILSCGLALQAQDGLDLDDIDLDEVEVVMEEDWLDDDFLAEIPFEEYMDETISVHPFDDKLWTEAKGDLNYDPAKEEEKKEEPDSTRTNANTNANTPSNNGGGWDWFSFSAGDGFWQVLFKMILLILAIVLLAMLVYRLSGGSFQAARQGGQKGSHTGSSVDIEKVEQNLQKSDMEILIDKALAEGNYMLAVRLHYLWAIKELNQRRLIKWKRDKTNRDYIRELGGSELKKPFRQATRIFERVWYGSQDSLSQSEYLPIEQQLQAFIRQVRGR